MVEKWRDGKISNQFYLMLLNYHGSRSYSDLSQYPVIPWFVDGSSDFSLFKMDQFEEEKVLIRDFSKNLNMLGSEKRLEQSKERYYLGEGLDEDRYFSGTHYSNPGVILQYLVRIPPFLDGLIKFQSGRLD